MSDKIEEQYFVSKESALDHAVTSMLLCLATKAPRLEEWRGAVVRPEPLVIYDINGQPLFYEFSVEKDKKTIGRIKASASKVLGPAVYTLDIGPRLLDLQKATEQAKRIGREKHKQAEIASVQLVCYCYPRLGILVVLADSRTKQEIDRIVVNAATHEVVTNVPPEKGRHRGTAIWSMYGSIPQKDIADRVLRWEADDRLREFLKKEAKSAKINVRGRLSEREMKAIEEAFSKVFVEQPSEKNEYPRAPVPDPPGQTGPFEVPMPITIWAVSKVIPLTLHGQEQDMWCGQATDQMTLAYYRFKYEQTEIFELHGTLEENTATWTHNYIQAVEEYNAPTWDEIVSEIEQNQPFHSGIQGTWWGHDRACGGYQWMRVPQGSTYATRHYLYVYDPWPPPSDPNHPNTFCTPNGGTQGWEDWDAMTPYYGDHYYFRPCKGTMKCT